ncbi:hypothetical protein NKY66_11000 [Sinorhizobium meliloti]|uniref:hypothetical protein n=1 Tax=Rhizobium meliloti TaxID=382 RepID=UPI003D649DA1
MRKSLYGIVLISIALGAEKAVAACTADIANLPLRTEADCRNTTDPQNCLDNLAPFNRIIEACKSEVYGKDAQRVTTTDETSDEPKTRSTKLDDADEQALQQAREIRERESFRGPVPGDLDGDGIVSPNEALAALPGVVKDNPGSNDFSGSWLLTTGGRSWSFTADVGGRFSSSDSYTVSWGGRTATITRVIGGSVTFADVSVNFNPIGSSIPEVRGLPKICSGTRTGENSYSGRCLSGSKGNWAFTFEKR